MSGVTCMSDEAFRCPTVIATLPPQNELPCSIGSCRLSSPPSRQSPPRPRTSSASASHTGRRCGGTCRPRRWTPTSASARRGHRRRRRPRQLWRQQQRRRCCPACFRRCSLRRIRAGVLQQLGGLGREARQGSWGCYGRCSTSSSVDRGRGRGFFSSVNTRLGQADSG